MSILPPSYVLLHFNVTVRRAGIAGPSFAEGIIHHRLTPGTGSQAGYRLRM
jgi:hypothetical protein